MSNGNRHALRKALTDVVTMEPEKRRESSVYNTTEEVKNKSGRHTEEEEDEGSEGIQRNSWESGVHLINGTMHSE